VETPKGAATAAEEPLDETIPPIEAELDVAETLDSSVNRYKDQIIACRKRLFEIADDTSGWSLLKVADGVTISTKRLPGSNEGTITVRGEKVVNFPALAIQGELEGIEKKKQYDPMIKVAKIIEQLDSCTAVTYESYDTVWPVAPRESLYRTNLSSPLSSQH